MELGRVVYYYVRLRDSLKDITGSPQVIKKIVDNLNIIEEYLVSNGIEPYYAEDWLRRNDRLIDISRANIEYPPSPPESSDVFSRLQKITIDELNMLDKVNAEFLYSLKGLNLLEDGNEMP